MIFTGKRPKNIGIDNGKLAACPNKPNCVCSQDTRPSHKIEPLAASAINMENVKATVSSMQGTKIIFSDSHYLHAECKSKILGFIDDLEIFWDEEGKVFHVRSASRLGYSDLGANRKRIENLRKRLLSAEAAPESA